MTTTEPPDTATELAPSPSGKTPTSFGDRLFSGLAVGSGIFILITLAGVALFLMSEAFPTFTNDITEIEPGDTFLEYVAPLVFGTLLAAAIALLIATPLSIGIALFISHYAPRRLARTSSEKRYAASLYFWRMA